MHTLRKRRQKYLPHQRVTTTTVGATVSSGHGHDLNLKSILENVEGFLSPGQLGLPNFLNISGHRFNCQSCYALDFLISNSANGNSVWVNQRDIFLTGNVRKYIIDCFPVDEAERLCDSSLFNTDKYNSFDGEVLVNN
jgi:hypothetical protein